MAQASVTWIEGTATEPGGAVQVAPAFLASSATVYAPTVQPGAAPVAPSFVTSDRRLEVWDRRHTVRQAVFQETLTLERTHVLGGEESLTASVSPADPAADHLTRGSVLRVQEIGSSAFTLWRYTGSQKARTPEDALTLEISADALWMDFRHGMVRDVQADGRTLMTFGLVGLTPTEWLQDYLIPGYDDDAIAFAAGTVEVADPVDLDFEDTSPLAGLRLLESELGDAEIQFRLNAAGDTYLIDILERVGKASGGAELRYRKNVRGLQKEEEETEAVSRMYAHGADGLTLADARWTVAGVAGGVISFHGEHPVFEDGAFVGLYFYSGGAAYQITASDATAGTITVADATGIGAGDEGWLAVDAQGTQLVYLQSPSAYSEFGVRVGLHETDIPNVANLLTNGDFTSWSGGLPVGWSLEGTATVSQYADPVYGRNGGVTAHVNAEEGGGLLSAAIDVTDDSALPYHSILCGLTIVSGRVRMELRHSNGKTYPLEEQARTTSEGAYTTLRSYPVSAEPLPAGTAQLAVVAHEGAAEFYLDAAMVTRSIGSTEPSFLVGSGAHDLWWETANELARSGRPKVEYRVDVADLFRADPDAYPFDALGLGDDVKIRDPAIGQETLRVVEITEDLINAAATRLSVAADAWGRPNDPYRKHPKRRRVSPSGPPANPNPTMGAPSLEYDPSDGTLYLVSIGGARSRSARFEFSDQSDFSSNVTQIDASVTEGDAIEATKTLAASDLGKRWYGRVRGYTGPLAASVVSGSAGPWGRDETAVPETDTNEVTALTDERKMGASFDTLQLLGEIGARTQGLRITVTPDPETGTGSATWDEDVSAVSNRSFRINVQDGEGNIAEVPFDSPELTIEVTPYTGFSAGSVDGTAGQTKQTVVPAGSESGDVGSRNQTTISTSDPSGTPATGVGHLWLKTT